jgi:RNase P/RNase MRP subunit p29
MSETFPLSLIGLRLTIKSTRFNGDCLVIGETANTIKVRTGARTLILPKKELTLLLKTGKVKGSSLVGQPWVRFKRGK